MVNEAKPVFAPSVTVTRHLGANLLPALGVVLAIALADLWQATTIVRKVNLPLTLGATFVLSFLPAIPLTAVMTIARQWARPHRTRRLVIGLIESVTIAGLVFLVEGYDSIASPVLWALAGIAVLSRLFVATIHTESRWIVVAKLGLLALCLFAVIWMPWRQKPVMRVAMDLTIAMVVGALLWRKVVKLPVVWCWAPVAVATGLSVGLSLLLRVKGSVRDVVLDSTTQAKATMELLVEHCPRCVNQRHMSIGPRLCRGNKTPKCQARQLTEKSALSGAAKGADVLLISFDSLRADLRDEVVPLFNEMGTTAAFHNAYSTAPGTRLAFGSIWRGRVVRRVPFSEANLFGGVSTRDGSMTLATALNAQGYRSVLVIPQRFFNPVAGLSTGFELAYVDPSLPPLDAAHQDMPVVPFNVATEHALKLAANTDKPLLLWTHAFETHYPYGGRENREQQSQAGQRKAVKRLVPLATSYLKQFRALRQGRPLIVVMFGDHGEEFGEHGGLHHSSTVYREQTQVVLAMSGPGLNAATITKPVSLGALPATLMDWLGLEIPCDFDLPSVLPCIEHSSMCPKVVESSTPRSGGLHAYTGDRYRILLKRAASLESVYNVTQDKFDQDPKQGTEAILEPSEIEFRRNIVEFDRRYCVERIVTGGD
jgi:hypothetical protein